MKKFLFLAVIVLSLVFIPVLSFAQNGPGPIIAPTPLDTIPLESPQQMPSIQSNQIVLPTQGLPTLIEPRQSSGGFMCFFNSDSRLGDLIDYVTCIISRSIIPLIFVLAFLMFIWGVVQYVIGAQEEAQRQKGRDFMIWGVIALAVMFSVWGLVSILGNTFGINNVIPSVQNK